MVDGWLRTGDIGVVDERGLLKFVDRVKDMIISGGLNISAAEVERVIMECPGVEEVAVLAAPDDRFGETRMREALASAAPGAASAGDAIVKAVQRYVAERPQFDDITLVSLARK